MNDPGMNISEGRKVGRAAGTVGFFTLISRILGLIRDMVIAGFFGSGMAADAFFVAFRIPNLLRRLFAEGSLTVAFIPVFTQYLRQKSKEEAFDLARVTLTLLSLLLVVVTIVGILSAPWIVRIQAFGFGDSGAKYELTVLLTRITFPYILFISLVAFFMGVLNSLRHFASPAAAPIFLNVGIIACTLWLSPHCPEPIMGVAIGVLLGGSLQLALQIPVALNLGVSLWPRWMPGHPAVKRIGLLMLPTIFGSAVYQLNQFVGTLLASFLPEGSVSWLYYADRLVQFPLGVFAIAISTAALPSLSKHVADQDLHEFNHTLSHALRMVSTAAIPSTVGLMILGKLIIQVLFQRGAFDALSTEMTYQALVFYSLGLYAFSGIRVIVSAFYALQDTRTPVKVACIALVANLIFSLLLMGPLKHGGLALSLSLASTIQLFLLVLILRKRIVNWQIGHLSFSVFKSLLASAVMGVALLWAIGRWWGSDPGTGLWQLSTRLIILVLGGSMVYFGMAAALGSKEVLFVLNRFAPILRKMK
jgi:putative peptidoglycan lipid II flippase